MTGSGLETIISTDIHTPNGLAADYRSQKLYWSDARLDKIERCNYNGEDRQVRLITTDDVVLCMTDNHKLWLLGGGFQIPPACVWPGGV